MAEFRHLCVLVCLFALVSFSACAGTIRIWIGRDSSSNSRNESIMKDISAAYMYHEEGFFETIQPMRVIEREETKPVAANPARLAELEKKHDEQGLTTHEALELAILKRELNNEDIIQMMEKSEDV